jgi:hypothetical protein
MDPYPGMVIIQQGNIERDDLHGLRPYTSVKLIAFRNPKPKLIVVLPAINAEWTRLNKTAGKGIRSRFNIDGPSHRLVKSGLVFPEKFFQFLVSATHVLTFFPKKIFINLYILRPCFT